MPKHFNRIVLTVIAVVFGLTAVVAVNTGKSSMSETEPASEDSFDAGKFIIGHVLDSYEWHIASFGNTRISIPLPVILYSKNPELHNDRSFHFFMSSKFHNGNGSYNGFKISRSEKYNGKIVELDREDAEIGRPYDFSVTKAVAGAVSASVVLFILLFVAARTAKRKRGRAPSGILNLVEPVIVFIRDEIALPSIGEKHYKRFMPPLLTLFFFILLNNLLGLIPIFPFGANVTGNISVTMVLALFTFVVTNLNGNRQYWKDIFNPDVPLLLKLPIPLMPFLELSGMITKPFVLMVRLFANMLAGHMIVTVFLSLIFIFSNLMGPAVGFGVSPLSVVFAVFITLLDVLVSFIQAYVFTLLSAIYFGMATAESH